MPLVFIVSKVFLMRSSEKLNLLRLRTELYSWSISSLYIGVIISKNVLSNTTTVAESLCFDINADTITFVSMIAKSPYYSPLLAALISSFISSSVISVRPFLLASALRAQNARRPFAATSSSGSVLISNGILLSLTIVFIKIVRAAVLLSPNSSQSLSKSFFNESSTLNVIVVCAIIYKYIANIYTIYVQCKYCSH